MDEQMLASLVRLEARLPEPIETDEEIALAEEMLVDASSEARAHGNQMWTPESVPAGVVNIVLRAAARGYMNPAGFTQEAADSARLQREESYAQGAALTSSEIRQVKTFAKRSGITYARVTKPDAWRAQSDWHQRGTYWVTFENEAQKPFPWY